MCRVCVTMRGTRLGRQCFCVGTGSKPRTSTSVHWRPTTISRMNRARITFIAVQKCLDALRQWFMRRACVASCTLFAGMRQRARYFSNSSVIVNDTCAVRAWFMRNSSGISTPDTQKKWSISRPTSMHKPDLCMICEWFVRVQLCDWPFMLRSQIKLTSYDFSDFHITGEFDNRPGTGRYF